MNCTACNSSDFYMDFEGYFCNVCHQRVEETRDEQVDEDVVTSKRQMVNSVTRKKRKDKIKFFAPWITAEAFNIIIYKQVAALIELGASEKLKDVVLCLWSHYLSKCEIAFRTDSGADEGVPRLAAIPKMRDEKVLYGDGLVKLKTAKKKKRKQEEICDQDVDGKLKESECESTDADLSEFAKSDLEEADGGSHTGKSLSPKSEEIDFSSDASKLISDTDDTSGNQTDDSSTGMTPKKYKYSKVARKIQKKRGMEWCKRFPQKVSVGEILPSQMTLTKTLCFCYLGLIYTRDCLTLCDLLRLVNNGKIPFLNAYDCLPERMKLERQDMQTFQTILTPEMSTISKVSARLCDFLNLPPLRHRPLMPMICCIVKDLNLPIRIISIAQRVVKELLKGEFEYFKPTFLRCTIVSIPLYDLQAVAVIIVCLKLLYILDDEFEVKHSATMSKINELNADNNMFVWDDWKRQMMLKEFLFSKNGTKYSDLSKLDALSIERICAKYSEFSLKRPPEDFGSNIIRARLASKKQMKNILQQSPAVNNAFQDRPTSFPMTFQLKQFKEQWRALSLYKCTNGIDFSFIEHDFSTDLLFYNISDLRSKQNESEIEDLLQTLYSRGNSSEVKLEDEEIIPRCTFNYWTKEHFRKKIPTQKLMKELPKSFAWLLQFLSNYVGCLSDELFVQVTCVEKKVLTNKLNKVYV